MPAYLIFCGCWYKSAPDIRTATPTTYRDGALGLNLQLVQRSR
jgi:hypothetical protein